MMSAALQRLMQPRVTATDRSWKAYTAELTPKTNQSNVKEM
eukprot:COSAG02_NODE_4091_length_5797_cov_127.687434_3_plen_41_part_00